MQTLKRLNSAAQSTDRPEDPWWFKKGSPTSYELESGGRGMTATGTLVVNGAPVEVSTLVTSKSSRDNK